MTALAAKRIWVAGHRGMVGSAVMRRLSTCDVELLTADRDTLDLRDQNSVRGWMEKNRPELVFLCAAKVGGILANSHYPADFLVDNLLIQTNIIESAHAIGVEKLLFLGSSCIYPRLAPQPIPEAALLTGALEPTNDAYAIAKITGLKLCDAYRRQHGANFIAAMPTNLYGPGDNFDLQSSHVIPAMLRKMHEAKQAGGAVTLWGTGSPLREFLHVDDLADALIFLMQHYDEAGPINVGTGEEISIKDLAHLIARTTGFAGEIVFDATKPDGTPRKRLNVDRLTALGWQARTRLSDGLAATYRWFVDHHQRDARL